GPCRGRPSVVWAGNQTHLFVRGADDDVAWMQRTPGSQGVWASLGGTILASPTALQRFGGIDLYVRAGGGDLDYIRYASATGDASAAAWSGWMNLLGVLQ